MKLTKTNAGLDNADLDKCRYSGYGIELDSCSEFLFIYGSFGKNVIIFEAHMS